MEELCRRMGWTLLEAIDGEGAFADAGLGVPGDEIRMLAGDGHINDISLQITQLVSDSGADRDHFINDTVLGEPTDRQHTDPSTVRWRLEDSTVLRHRSTRLQLLSGEPGAHGRSAIAPGGRAASIGGSTTIVLRRRSGGNRPVNRVPGSFTSGG